MDKLCKEIMAANAEKKPLELVVEVLNCAELKLTQYVLKDSGSSIDNKMTTWVAHPLGADRKEPYVTIGCITCNRQFSEVAALMIADAPLDMVKAAMAELGARLAKLSLAVHKRETLDMYEQTLSLLEPFSKIGLQLKSKKGNDKKYQVDRAPYLMAADVAKKKWLAGDNMLHNEMRKFLMEKYTDECGKHPFNLLKIDKLLKQLKNAAVEIDKPELVYSGFSKKQK